MQNEETRETIDPSEIESSTPEVTIESLQKELADMKDQWLRSMAEIENIRRRTQKEKEDTLKYATSHFARDVLAITDNLQRALKSCPDRDTLPESVKALITGVELTEAELVKILDKHNIKSISPLHEPFDPNYHQAMFEVETDDHPEGTVTEILQLGYTLHDRLLRPALVGVSKASTAKNN